MKDELINFETAKLAKEKGFEEECLHFYCENNICDYLIEPYEYSFKVNANIKSKDNFGYGITYSAPTQSLLQKWLREKYYIHIDIKVLGQGLYNLEVNKLAGETLILGNKESYEKALEIGLLEALKLIKNEG